MHPLTPTCPSHPEFQCCFFFMGASGAKGGKKNSSLASPANCSRRAAFQATLKWRVQGSAAKRGAIFFPVTVYSFCGLVKKKNPKGVPQHNTQRAERTTERGDGKWGRWWGGGSPSPAESDRAGEKENENEGTATGTCSLTPRLHQTAALVRDCPFHTTTTDHVLFACFVAVVAPASRQDY